MAYLTETSEFDANVYRLDATDPLLGCFGEQPSQLGELNRAQQALTNRSRYLKDNLDLAAALGNAIKVQLSVADASELALVDLDSGLTISQTLGALTAGDGGGGIWRWDAESTADDNTGTVICPQGHTDAGRWLRVYTHTVNLAWFGACTDGTEPTATATALQAAADAVPDGGQLIIPAGVYAVNHVTTLSKRSKVTIRGEGRPTFTLPSGMMPTVTKASLFYLDRCTDVTISGLAIDGNGAAYHTGHNHYASYDYFRAFWIVGCTNVVIQDCALSDWVGVGVKVVALGARGGMGNALYDAALPGCDGLRVQWCRFERVASPIQLNPSTTKRVYIQDNYIFDTEYYGIAVYMHSYDLSITGNVLENIGQSVAPDINKGEAIRVTESKRVLISGNRITGAIRGIHIENYYGDFYPQDITITDNVIVDCAYRNNPTAWPFYLAAHGLNMTIRGNVMRQTDSSDGVLAISIQGTNITFIDNCLLNYKPGVTGNCMRVGSDLGSGNTTPVMPSDTVRIDHNWFDVVGSMYVIVLLNNADKLTNISMRSNKFTGYTRTPVYDPIAAVTDYGKPRLSYEYVFTDADTIKTIKTAGLLDNIVIAHACWIDQIVIAVNGTVSGNITVYLYKNGTHIDGTAACLSAQTVLTSGNKSLNINVARGKQFADSASLVRFIKGDILTCKVAADFSYTGQGSIAVVFTKE